MTMVAYDNVIFTEDFCKIKEDSEEYASTEGQLYEDLLEALSLEFFKEKFTLCLQLKKDEHVIYEFPKVPCPALFLEQLRIRKI